MSQKLFPRDPLFFSPTIKIFIGTKAEGTELLRWQIKVQIGRWGKARCGVEGALQMPQEGSLWSGLERHPSPHPGSEDPPLTSPISYPSWGQLGSCSDPIGRDHPFDPPMAVSQSVSLPHFPNKEDTGLTWQPGSSQCTSLLPGASLKSPVCGTVWDQGRSCCVLTLPCFSLTEKTLPFPGSHGVGPEEPIPDTKPS